MPVELSFMFIMLAVSFVFSVIVYLIIKDLSWTTLVFAVFFIVTSVICFYSFVEYKDMSTPEALTLKTNKQGQTIYYVDSKSSTTTPKYTFKTVDNKSIHVDSHLTIKYNVSSKSKLVVRKYKEQTKFFGLTSIDTRGLSRYTAYVTK